MATNSEILSFAPGAGYLSNIALAKGKLFNKNKLNPLLPRQIYALYYIIKKVYDYDPNYSGMDVACQYLWEVMGRFGIAAQGLSGGGGSVTPVVPPTTADPLIFIVSSVSDIPTGGSSLTIPSFVGYNLQFSRNGIVQSTISTEPSYYTWDKTVALFTCSPAAFVGELFILMPT
jgi:hypothetical protein